MELCLFSGAFIAVYFGVAVFRRWSLKRGVLDHPNDRSSHVAPTPRGGGLVLALVTLMVYLFGSWLFEFEASWGFVTGAALIVLVSWLDDVYSVPFIWRLLVQSAAACLVIASNGYMSSVALGATSAPIEFGRFGIVLTFAWIIWLVNAYNFMDGIDGIAGMQAVAAGMGWLLLGLFWQMSAAWLLGGTAMSVGMAFLLHNWPPARIFMGDAGSAFLGFVFATLPLLSRSDDQARNSVLPLAGVLFVWLFVFDSVLTFIRRAIRREKVWNAHREHLYQRLVISGYAHRTVTLLYGVIALVVSAATLWALVTRSGDAFGILAAVVSLLTCALLLLCWKRKCLFGPVRN